MPVLAILFIFISLIVLIGIPAMFIEWSGCRNTLEVAGYSIGDVDAFASATNFDACNVLKSDGARAEFERFVRGDGVNPKHRKRQQTHSTVIVPLMVR